MLEEENGCVWCVCVCVWVGPWYIMLQSCIMYSIQCRPCLWMYECASSNCAFCKCPISFMRFRHFRLIQMTNDKRRVSMPFVWMTSDEVQIIVREKRLSWGYYTENTKFRDNVQFTNWNAQLNSNLLWMEKSTNCRATVRFWLCKKEHCFAI